MVNQDGIRAKNSYRLFTGIVVLFFAMSFDTPNLLAHQSNANELIVISVDGSIDDSIETRCITQFCFSYPADSNKQLESIFE